MDRLEGARSRFDLRLAGAVIIQVPLWLAGRWLFQAETSEGAILSSLVCAETFLLLVMGLSARRPAESPPVALPQMAEIESLRAGLSEREAQLGVAQARVRDIDNAVGSMQRAGSDCLDLMRASCVSLRRTADDVSRAALRISTETTTVAVTAEDADRKIAGVAMFGQDFASSISQIGECAARSARMGIEASGQIETAIATIEELKSTSDGIGAMTALISKIADQTNLLALNATIEAARAGEQGRGFAVVAGEVKALATETGKAVAAIGDMVAKIRGSTDRTVVAIGAITTALRDLNGASTDISAAIGQRVAAADSMADGLTETATCISFVAAAIKNIESAADETLQDAGFLHATADEIAQYAETIRGGLARCADGLGAADPPAGARARRVANGTHEQDAREAA